MATLDIIFEDALSAIGSGLSWDETFNVLLDAYEAVEAADISSTMQEALQDAVKLGVEREDVDPSWFEH